MVAWSGRRSVTGVRGRIMKRSPLGVVRGHLPLLAGVVLACLVVLVGPTSSLADPSFDYSTYHDEVMDLVNLYATGSSGSLTAAQRQQLLSMQSWAFADPGSPAATIESNLASAARVDAAVPQVPDILDAAETAAGGPGINGWEAADAEGVALASGLTSGPVVIGYSLGGGQDLELHLSCSIDGLGSGSCAAENADPTYSVWVKPMGQFLYNEPFSWAGPEDYCACTPGYGTKDYDGTRHWHDGYYYDEAWGPTSGTTDSPYAGGSGAGARPGTLYIPHHDGSLLPAELPSTTSYPQEIGAFRKLATLPLGGWAFWDTSNFDIGDACTYDYGASNYEACADWITPASDFTLETTEPPKTVSSSTLASDGGTVVAAPSPLACADSSSCYTQITGIIDSDTTTKEWVEHVLDPSDFPDNPLVAAVPPAQTLGPSSSDLTTGTTAHQGEPVDTATGNFYSSAVDVSLPGVGVPFVFTRSYNSGDATSGRLGVGWTDNLDWSLSIGGGGDATVHAGTGQQIHFAASGGSFVADPGVTATLTAVSGGYELVTRDQLHYVFDSSGKLTGESDRNGQGLTLTYSSGVLSSVTDSVGRTITFTTTSGHLTGIALPDSRSVSYGYTSGKLTSFTDLNGHTVSYGYDTNGLLNQITDQNGNTVIANVYDGTSHRVTEQTDGRGHHSYFSWNATTQTSTYTDARGKEWTDVYVGNVLQNETDPDGDTTSYYYDSDDDLIAVTDPNGNTTSYSYDTAGNKLTETAPSPLSYLQSWTYDAKNDVTSYTNGDGNTTTYAYNTAGDLTSVTGPDPDGAGSETAPVTSYGRDATTGQLTSVTDPRGKETDYGYDADGNLTSVTTPEGEETTYGYDSGGRMTSKVEARGNVSGCSCTASYTWTYTYDDANHMLTQTDPLSHETTWTYYPGGQLETVTDANSHTTTYAYDDDNNLSTVTAPDSTVNTYTYDENNNQLTKEDANSHTTTYTYDDANRLASKELPGGQTWTYSYDNDGDLATMVNANGNATMTTGDGTTTYGYDNLDRLTSIDYSDAGISDVTYTYDGDGNRTQMTDGGTVSYGYDNLDRLTGVTRSSHTFSYGYDANSNLTSETYPDTTSVAYTYTDDEQLHTAVSNSQTTTYSYDPAGNPTATALPSGNGYTETDSYDHAGRLTEVENHNGATVLSDFAYTLDPLGNPTKTIRTGDISSTTTYGYDQPRPPHLPVPPAQLPALHRPEDQLDVRQRRQPAHPDHHRRHRHRNLQQRRPPHRRGLDQLQLRRQRQPNRRRQQQLQLRPGEPARVSHRRSNHNRLQLRRRRQPPRRPTTAPTPPTTGGTPPLRRRSSTPKPTDPAPPSATTSTETNSSP